MAVKQSSEIKNPSRDGLIKLIVRILTTADENVDLKKKLSSELFEQYLKNIPLNEIATKYNISVKAEDVDSAGATITFYVPKEYHVKDMSSDIFVLAIQTDADLTFNVSDHTN